MKRRAFLFLLVTFLATILRLYQLGKTPIALEWDEVAIGYDAYSILHTGRDQFGTWFPLTFRSLDDYKPPIYEYLAVPTIGLFGLNEFGVRLPSALAGIVAVVLTIFLAKEIAAHIPGLSRQSVRIGLLAGFFLAVSPWNLQFSRAAFEVNVSICITVAAVLCFLVGLRRPRFLILSAILFGIDLFSYHSTRVVSPLLMVALILLHHHRLTQKKYILSFIGFYLFFFAAVLPILLSKEAQIRFAATNIISPAVPYLDDLDLPAEFLQRRQEDAVAGFEQAGKIFHNHRLLFLDYEIMRKVAVNYISHFGFEYLFVKGDAPLHHAPDFGLLYIWELPFLLLGGLYLLRHTNRYTLVIVAWMLLAPIPVAVTRDAPHAVRSELLLPTFQMVTAVGVWLTAEFIIQEFSWLGVIAVVAGIGLYSFNMAYYFHQYYVHTNYELSDKWLYGRKEAAQITEKLKGKYDRVIISTRLEMPYMFWLFYTHYPPEKYLAEGGTVSGGFAEDRNHFDTYEFHTFDYHALPKDENILLVGREGGIPSDFPGGAHVLERIPYLDGSKGLIIATNK